MQTKNLLKQTGLAVSLTIIALIVLEFSVQRGSVLPVINYLPKSIAKKITIGLPMYFKIPTINVDTLVEYVGITKGGAMEVPKNPDLVAWFDLGPKPGQSGSAVVAGHSGWKDGIPAVFDNLYKLNIGDKVYIEDEFGSTTVFVVRKIRTYDPDVDTQNIFDSTDGKAHLNLITCGGDWNNITQSSSKRLVVFTDMVVN